jgi:hypothetical protein
MIKIKANQSKLIPEFSGCFLEFFVLFSSAIDICVDELMLSGI